MGGKKAICSIITQMNMVPGNLEYSSIFIQGKEAEM